jgi:hypothetical protein
MNVLLFMKHISFVVNHSGSIFIIFIRRLEKDLAAAHTMLLHQRSHASQELHLTTQLAQGPTSCAACIKMSFKFVLVSAMRSIRSLQLMMGTNPKRLHDEHIV